MFKRFIILLFLVSGLFAQLVPKDYEDPLERHWGKIQIQGDSLLFLSPDLQDTSYLWFDGTSMHITDFMVDVASANQVYIDVVNKTGATINKGTPVYVAGYDVTTALATIDSADADNASAMPVLGLVSADILDDASGTVIISGRLSGIATDSWSVGDELYISTTPAVLTSTAPSGPTDYVQKVGQVLKSHASTGIVVIGNYYAALGGDDDIPESGDLGIIDTEAKFEAELFPIFTPNDGALNDDDVTLGDVQNATTSDFHNIGGIDDDLPDADEVVESMLKAVNIPTDEDIFTFESTTGDFEWHTPSELGLITSESDPLALLIAGTDNVKDTHIDWGTGAGQISAVDILIADVGVKITATEVEGALQENRTAIDLNTAKETDDDIGVAEIYNITNWDADTGSPQKNDLRDYFALFDTDGDGDIDNLDATNLASSIVELDPVYSADPAFSIISGDITNLGNLSGTNSGDATYGIANTNAVKVTVIDVATTEYARFNTTGLESRTLAEIMTDMNLSGTNTGDQDLSGLLLKTAFVDSFRNNLSYSITGNTETGITVTYQGDGTIDYVVTGAPPIFDIRDGGVLISSNPLDLDFLGADFVLSDVAKADSVEISIADGALNDEYIELADPFGGEVSGTYDNIIIDNNALDDQYFDAHADVDHDQTANFTQDEHFLQSAISIPASQISDFDTEVSNNTSVAANTSKVTDDDVGVAGVYGVGWNTDTNAPQKNDIYDILHQYDTDDDGDVDNVDATYLAGAETDPNALLTAGTDNVKDTHIDWGTGAGQISAVDILIADVGVKITATEVEGALQENRTAIDLNTAKNTYPSADATKLSGIEDNATADQSGAEIKSLYEAEANAYTDTKDTKLSGIATGAEVNVNADWNSGSGDAQILNKPTIPSGNQIIDWTADQGATNIHSGNYTDTNTQLDSTGIDNYNFVPDLEFATWKNGVDQTEMGYLDGVTSDIQTQFSNKQPLDGALTNISGLIYVSPSFIKMTANDTYAVRTITETKTDLSLENVTNVAIDNTAYNATSWDANSDGATKDAIRDKIEGLAGGHDAVTLNANATAGGLSLSTQELNFRAATNAQTGYATASHISAIEANTAKDTDDDIGVAEVYNITNWDADTGSPQKNDLRDYFVLFDTDGDGDLDNFDATNLASSIVELDPSVDTHDEIEAILVNDILDLGTGGIYTTGGDFGDANVTNIGQLSIDELIADDGSTITITDSTYFADDVNIAGLLHITTATGTALTTLLRLHNTGESGYTGAIDFAYGAGNVVLGKIVTEYQSVNDGKLNFYVANNSTLPETPQLSVNGNGQVIVANNLTANGNHVMEGYATGRNAIRTIQLQLQPGGTPNTNINISNFSATDNRGFNPPSITNAINLAKSGTEGSFSLNAGGTSLTMNLTETIIGIGTYGFVSTHLINSASDELYSVLFWVTAGNLTMKIYKQGSGTNVDWTSILDASDSFSLQITFYTSS